MAVRTELVGVDDYRILFESAPGLCLVLRPDLTIVAVSNAYLRATMTERQNIIGRGLFDVFPDNPNDPHADGVSNLRASLKRVMTERISDAMPVQKYDIRRPESEGGGFEERFWSPVNSPVFGPSGELIYIIHQVEDVTEFIRLKQKGMEESKLTQELRTRAGQMEIEIFQRAQQLGEANQRLRTANEELEAFSYSVSHDLRAPLRHIAGFAEMLRRDFSNPDSKAEHRVQVIIDSAGRMGQLIDGLLALCHMGRSDLRPTLVKFDELLAETRNEMADDLAGRDILWEIDPLPELMVDRATFKQVWVNLLGNAVKYTRQRHPAKIKITAQKNDRAEWEFSIHDNGAGFDMEQAHKLFGVFQRLHKSEEFEGTGVGLAMVQRIVQRHGGRIWADGHVNAGATFYFTLRDSSSANVNSPQHQLQ